MEMEMGKKKLWNLVRIVLRMMREKSKISLQELHKTAAKLFLHHRRNYYFALTCRSTDALNSSFHVAPRHYEFSCTDTPTYILRRRRRRSEQQNVQDAMEASPMALPGFGCSPIVRQLRVSDSPYSIRGGEEEEEKVDEDAEEFIEKFYKDLKKQRRIAAAMGSPSPYPQWG